MKMDWSYAWEEMTEPPLINSSGLVISSSAIAIRCHDACLLIREKINQLLLASNKLNHLQNSD